MVICLEPSADLHMAQLMPLPLTVSYFSKIQIGFTFLILAYPRVPGKRAVKQVCVCDFVVFCLVPLVPRQQIGWEEPLGTELFCVERDIKCQCTLNLFDFLASLIPGLLTCYL